MKSTTKALLVPCVSALMLTSAVASATDYLRRVPSAAWLGWTGNSVGGTMSGPLGLDVPAPGPKWWIAQWNIPASLSTTPTDLGGGSWQVANGYARVKYINDSSSGVWEFGQNGAGVPCEKEFDLFLGPVSQGANCPNGPCPQGFVSYNDAPPLSELTVLRMDAGARITYEHIVETCTESGHYPPQDVNFAFYVLAVVFTNATTGQVLFYQVILRDTQGYSYDAGWCPQTQEPGGTNPVNNYCVNDSPDLIYATPRLQPFGPRVFYSLDVLPRVQFLISTNHNLPPERNPLDTDLSHWRPTGFYFGQGLQGGAIPTSQWDSFNFTGG